MKNVNYSYLKEGYFLQIILKNYSDINMSIWW